MRGLAVAGSRPSQGVAAQFKNADIEDVSQLGVELLARPASGLGQRCLTHRNPDLRVTSIDQRGAPIPAVHGTEIERQGLPRCRLCCTSICRSLGAQSRPYDGTLADTRFHLFSDAIRRRGSVRRWREAMATPLY